jgi:D-alanyl-D-alanine carboxypeptidase/D-alanyl-D-alanine-endopeptidase (penicillin-binding protein 4)
LACGEKTWPLAYGEPKRFNAMLVAGLWKSMGGKLSGRVREGTAPTSEPSFRFSSPSLGETVRDINKFSNNVMAQQLFLTLGLQGDGQSSPAAARDFMARWMSRHLGSASEGCVIENGSGLSRDNRVTAEALSALLAQTWRSPWMPELASALPVSGVDGTLVRSGLPTGRAHLKTGSLRDVFGLAGYVLAANGRRYVLVGLINHPQANSGRAALDAAARWTMAIP